VDSDESSPETCETVGLVLVKTELELDEGLTLVCLHPEYATAPFMELCLESLSLSHHMMYDHDVLTGELLAPTLNDLTLWPKTIELHSYKSSAEQLQSKILVSGSAHPAECLQAEQDLLSMVEGLTRQEVFGGR
jgi:hypothetical protein